MIKTNPKTCEHCGKQFVRLPRRSISQWGKRRYCSHACLHTARKPLPVPCLHCGQMIIRKQARPERTKRFCNSTCANYFRFTAKKTRYRSIRIDGKKRAVHQVVAERKIRRLLRTHEVVHHIDLNKTNNDPSNLKVMSRQAHGRLHAALWRKG